MEATRRMLVVLELYSGIGGMHCALEESGIPFEVVTAIDINQISNSIYHRNFPQTKLRTKCLSTLTLSELESFGADLVTMSPPCQPFTRVGKQRDAADERTKSLLHFLNLLPKLNKIPNYVLLENVKGFETSLTRDVTLKVLEQLDFVFQEFLLTPLQFSIPNSRLRYYILAKRRPLTFRFKTQPHILKTLPILTTESTDDDVKMLHQSFDFTNSEVFSLKEHSESSNNFDHRLHSLPINCDSVSGREHSEPRPPSPSSGKNVEVSCVQETVGYPLVRPLSEYLENQPDEYFKRFLLPKKFYRYFWVMDLVQKDSTITCCFTKRYGQYVEGAGSVVQMKPSQTDLTEFRALGTMIPECEKEIEALRLRFFTPREIANLMCFPPHFEFPDDMTNRQLYRALGNSVNVHLVSLLLRILV